MIPKNFSKILHCRFSYQTLPATPFSMVKGVKFRLNINLKTWGGGGATKILETTNKEKIKSLGIIYNNYCEIQV